MKLSGIVAVALIAALSAPRGAAACAIRTQTHIEPTPDGERFLLVLDRRRLKVVSRSGEVLAEMGADGPVAEAAISPDGKTIAYCPERRGLRILAVGDAAPSAPEKAGDCSDLAWTRDGASLAYVLAKTEVEAKAVVAVVHARLWTAGAGVKTLHVEKIPVKTWERDARAEMPGALPPAGPQAEAAPPPPRKEP